MKPQGKQNSSLLRTNANRPEFNLQAYRRRKRREGDTNDAVDQLQSQRIELQRKAVAAQERELDLFRQQMEEQRRLEEQNVGLLRSQLAEATTTASAYQQQLGLLQQAQESQNQLAALEQERTGLLTSQQNARMAVQANFQRNTLNRRRTVGQRTSGVGIFT